MGTLKFNINIKLWVPQRTLYAERPILLNKLKTTLTEKNELLIVEDSAALHLPGIQSLMTLNVILLPQIMPDIDRYIDWRHSVTYFDS